MEEIALICDSTVLLLDYSGEKRQKIKRSGHLADEMSSHLSPPPKILPNLILATI